MRKISDSVKRERKAAYMRKWKDANRDKIEASRLRNAHKHRAKVRARVRKWAKENPERVKENSRRNGKKPEVKRYRFYWHLKKRYDVRAMFHLQ
jgi:hypothetical protein